MAERLHPKEITVIVSSATGLPTGKSGKCRASVIFGVGKTKFRTQVVESTSPVWNERSIVPVTEGDSSSLVFQVTRKERPLGEVCVPLVDIPSVSGRTNNASLAPTSNGSLTYECWVTSTYSSPLVNAAGGLSRNKSMRGKIGSSIRGSFRGNSNSTGSLEQQSPRMTTAENGELVAAPNGGRKKSSTSTIGAPALFENDGVKGSKSMEATPDASGQRRNSFLGDKDDAAPRRRFSFSKGDKTNAEDLKTASNPNLAAPVQSSVTSKVTGISPRDGSIAGGKTITLRGENLGTSADDIKAITVCGVSCDLEYLEYVSPSKLTCRIPPGKVGNGPVLVETVAHGKGASTVTFTYWDPANKPEDRVPVLVDEEQSPQSGLSTQQPSPRERLGSHSKKKRLVPTVASLTRTSKDSQSGPPEENNKDKDSIISELTQRVTELESENQRLQTYIDRLISKVIEQDPQLLGS